MSRASWRAIRSNLLRAMSSSTTLASSKLWRACPVESGAPKRQIEPWSMRANCVRELLEICERSLAVNSHFYMLRTRPKSAQPVSKEAMSAATDDVDYPAICHPENQRLVERLI